MGGFGMDFSMDVCDTEEIKNEVVEIVKPVPQEINQLKKLSNKNVENLMNIDIDSLEQRAIVLKTIEEFGLDTIQKSSRKNELF